MNKDEAHNEGCNGNCGKAGICECGGTLYRYPFGWDHISKPLSSHDIEVVQSWNSCWPEYTVTR